MDLDRKIEILEELKKEGLFLGSGAFNASFPKKFKNSITPLRQEWYDSIVGESLSQKVYHLERNIETPPVCQECGKPVRFISPKEGYRQYCSTICRARGEANNVAQTNIKKYGAKAPAQNKAIQNKMKKTTQDRYGVDNIFQRTDIIKNSIMEKYGVENVMNLSSVKEDLRKSNFAKYGVEYTTAVPAFIAKRRETNLVKYGNPSSLHGKEISEKVLHTRKKEFWESLFVNPRFTSKATPLFTLEEYQGTVDSEVQVIYYPWKCIKCNQTFKDYFSYKRGPRCTHCYPHDGTEGLVERELRTWLEEEFPDKILERGNRELARPLEIDIYFPEEKFAIEFDEIAWHSELKTKGVRGEKYHLSKTTSLREKGVDLIHIFDSEWIGSPEIIKSMICARFGRFEKKIGARACTVHKVSSEVSRNFLEANHIQGYATSSIRYGLYYGEDLVSLLCLGKNRFKRNTYEVVRFVSKINTQVMGGLSKLWRIAKNDLPEDAILISYVDLRFFNGKSNEYLGLKYSHTNRPSFYYTKDYKSLYNRMLFQKGKLEHKLINFDPTLTEWENMKNNGYDRIWDCGTAVYTSYSQINSED